MRKLDPELSTAIVRYLGCQNEITPQLRELRDLRNPEHRYPTPQIGTLCWNIEGYR